MAGVVLDGGLATELERHGENIKHLRLNKAAPIESFDPASVSSCKILGKTRKIIFQDQSSGYMSH